jgi:hypothetical protein
MKRNKLDIVICGSSRPKLVPYCIESLRRFIISQSRNTDFRIIYSEDFVNTKDSEEVVKWCENNGVDRIIKNNPPIGYGNSLYNIINNEVKSEYMINLQDDWEFERTGIDIDRLIWTMKTNDIWSIVFHKYAINRYKKDHFNEEIDFTGLKLVPCNGFRMIPSIWNTNIVKNHFKKCDTKPEAALINSFGTGEERNDKNYCMKNVKSFYLGGKNEPRWVRHLGNTWRKRQFSNKYDNGCVEWDILDLRDKPQWIEHYIRPMNVKWCEASDPIKKDFFLKLLDTFPENIRKEFLK